jgi:hypothetical protein
MLLSRSISADSGREILLFAPGDVPDEVLGDTVSVESDVVDEVLQSNLKASVDHSHRKNAPDVQVESAGVA